MWHVGAFSAAMRSERCQRDVTGGVATSTKAKALFVGVSSMWWVKHFYLVRWTAHRTDCSCASLACRFDPSHLLLVTHHSKR